MAERIGVFGGSFNPLHIGHLVIAEAAWQEFALEKVIFVPTGDTPNKSMHSVDKYARYNMVRAATEGNPKFEVSDIELHRAGPSYTVDTIHALKSYWHGEKEIYFLAGTDAVADLPEWKYNEELLDSCHFICAARPGSEDKLARTIAYFGEQGKNKIHLLRMPELDISSTLLRQWVHEGKSVRYFIPDEVIAYMRDKGLYKESES